MNTLLIIEDDLGLSVLLSEIASQCGYGAHCVSTGTEAISWLSANMPFLIVLDYGLPDMDGRQFIDALRSQTDSIPPFIVSTGQGDERIAVQMMKLGARDYIVKDINFLEMMPIVIKKAETMIHSEQKLLLAQQTIQKNEELQRSMIENISDVIAILDADGISRYKSANIARIFGWQPHELLGKNAFELVHKDDKKMVQDVFAQLLGEKNIPRTMAFRYMSKDGPYRWVELTAINQIDNPSINGILVNYHDISQRKIAENELIASREKAVESDRLKTAFLQNMNHEIRTPMNAIMGFSSLLPDEFNNKEKLKEYTGIIIRRCNDLLAIMNDILDISKMESGILPVLLADCTVTELFSEIDDYVSVQKEYLDKNAITFIATIDPSVQHCVFQSDFAKLKQILINLINNALKFTHSGSIQISCTKKSAHLEFSVSDTGTGIPENKFDFIFERFAQLDPQDNTLISGTGLGLPVAKGLLTLLGGTIAVQSKLGAGSTFHFTIPFIENKHTAAEEKIYPHDNGALLAGKTILIVEDDAVNAMYLSEILTKTGATFYQTVLGSEALDFVAVQPPDLVLLDIRLPDIDGLTVARKIKETNADIRIIAQSAYVSTEYKKNAIESGCDAFIGKPIPKNVLLSMCESLLE